MNNPGISFVRMFTSLFFVTSLSSALVGVVFNFTKEQIEKTEEEMKLKAIRNVLPSFQKIDPAQEVEVRGVKSSCYVARDESDKFLGLAVRSSSMEGYSGLIEVMVGFNSHGEITGYEVLNHKETPGLGSKMQKWFSDTSRKNRNVVGRNPARKALFVIKDGGDIDAITSATISSRAFLQCLNRAGEVFKQYGGGDEIIK